MKRFMLFLALIPATAIAAAQPNVFDDGNWYYGNYYVTTKKHDPFGKYNYTMSFHMPTTGENSSDACLLTSPTRIQCYTGDSATYDANTHTVTVTSSMGHQFTFYRKSDMPKQSALVGHWERVKPHDLQNCENGYVSGITIPYNAAATTTFSGVTTDEEWGPWPNQTFYLHDSTVFGDKHLNISALPDTKYFKAYYLLDAKHQYVDDMSKLGTAQRLNDSYSWKNDPNCDFVKTN